MATNGEFRTIRIAAQRAVGALVVFLAASTAWAQGATQPTVEIYGFGMADAIADFKQNNPDWYDVVRPSRLPKAPEEFGKDGHFYLSARQSRLGVRGANADMKANFEFDIFGVGKDAGLTTMRMRHAWGQYKQIGGGLTNSAFMDADVFPNTLEYWGPNGMLFLRNPMLFWEPVSKPDGTNARIAIENPGASGDAGVYAERIELQNVRPRFPAPDFTGHYRKAMKWGYFQVGGALRYLAYDDVLTTDAFDLSDHVWAGGVSFSSNVKVTPNDVLRLQFIDGAGIENYFNDAPIDVGLKRNTDGDALTRPVKGQALRDIGLVLWLDHNWDKEWSTSVGYSRVDIGNSDAQSPNAYKNGQYMIFNLLRAPAPNVLVGGEFQWGRRENFSDGFTSNDYRIQVSVKYNFSAKMIGG